ncbi:glyoxalase/bleomycin resistance protein/dioxygenase [Nitrospirillum viridazoti Y2]|uniref:Catechol 2,3-dioxygenase-like lactoylglutathione lyase family enzyme n=1 Tax=Nitrospirillum amazonense TaxID=28077 RepID=A0A560IRE5_9PROT|nr:VOC family protein [Nitrospirillum amazonense]EGY00064.1 glyoxalase/bleomycin resistance protein/dioxygenase [Nitrospirillum amazonense Y2]TWB59624.1 catechol 2,3-dioxygenase-like lactoylglutathione lyase family enzyme [Nitrospirillum amazonense]
MTVQAGTAGAGLPLRLHHNAYVTADMEATRRFYEDLVGMPLVATYCETDHLFGADRVYCHCFFALSDGGALAFFQFASPEDQALFGPAMPPSPFHHIALKVDAATQAAVHGRFRAAGVPEPSDDCYFLDHGYCQSLYVRDPNGLIVELTVDAPGIEDTDEERKRNAHADLARWLGGDHRSNNLYRPQ